MTAPHQTDRPGTWVSRRLSAAPVLVLADFIIGVHALRNATALMTLNRDDFARMVPSLPLITPNINTPTAPNTL